VRICFISIMKIYKNVNTLFECILINNNYSVIYNNSMIYNDNNCIFGIFCYVLLKIGYYDMCMLAHV
jgi:hypothetical protein